MSEIEYLSRVRVGDAPLMHRRAKKALVAALGDMITMADVGQISLDEMNRMRGMGPSAVQSVIMSLRACVAASKNARTALEVAMEEDKHG